MNPSVWADHPRPGHCCLSDCEGQGFAVTMPSYGIVAASNTMPQQTRFAAMSAIPLQVPGILHHTSSNETEAASLCDAACKLRPGHTVHRRRNYRRRQLGHYPKDLPGGLHGFAGHLRFCLIDTQRGLHKDAKVPSTRLYSKPCSGPHLLQFIFLLLIHLTT